MPKPIILGRRTPHRQSIEVSFDPNQGVSTTEEWASAGDNLGGLAAAYAAQGVPYRMRPNGIRSTLIATASRNYATQDEALERWELLSQQDMPSILEHPNARTLLYASLKQVTTAVKQFEGTRSTPPDVSSFSVGQLRLYDLLIRGVTTYPVWRWVLRYTANVSGGYQLFTDANAGIGSIYTTSQLGVPGGRILSTIQSIPVPDGDDHLIWGWLKTAHTEVTAARNRAEVSAEFHLAGWPIYLYS